MSCEQQGVQDLRRETPSDPDKVLLWKTKINPVPNAIASQKTACANQRSRSLWCRTIRVIAVSLAVYFLLSEKKKHILPFLWPCLRLFLLLLYCRVVVEEVDIPRSGLVRAHKLLVAWWSCSRKENKPSAFDPHPHPLLIPKTERNNPTRQDDLLSAFVLLASIL